MIYFHHVFSIHHESLFIEDENGKVRRDLYDPPPPIVVLDGRRNEKTPIVNLGQHFLETHNDAHSNHRTEREPIDEEIEQLIYGSTVNDPLQVDWDRERTLLDWRKGPQFFNDMMSKSDTNHPFDKTRRCLGKMIHLNHNLTSTDCMYVDDELINLRNKQMSMKLVKLLKWEKYDSNKSEKDFIRQLKNTRDHDDYTHVIVVEFNMDLVHRKTFSICDMYLYWISYETQNVTCIPVSSTSILFDLSDQVSKTGDEAILDFLSRFKEIDDLSWRGFSSKPKENQKDDQMMNGYSNEEHFMNSLFIYRKS